MSDQFYVLEGFELRKGTHDEFSELLVDGGHILEHTALNDTVWVNTCLMGTDQREPPDEDLPPLLFVTSVIGLSYPEYPNWEQHTSTVGQAKNAHYRHVLSVRKLLKRKAQNDF